MNGRRKALTMPATVRKLRCAIYTRKITEEGLDQAFNSLDAQRDSCEAYVVSQRAEGWILVPDRYDDGGFSGSNLDRPALRRLLADIEAGRVDVVVVYKIDRLSRALMDFAKLVEVFDQHSVTFVSVTQSFNTTTSMGRLTLNILLSLRSVRTRGDRRAHSRQIRRLQGARHVDGRQGAARLSTCATVSSWSMKPRRRGCDASSRCSPKRNPALRRCAGSVPKA